MRHVGLTIGKPRQKQFTRSRRRKSLATGVLLAGVVAVGWWQIHEIAEERGVALLPVAFLEEAASLQPPHAREVTRAVSVAEYEARRSAYAERAPIVPLAELPPLGTPPEAADPAPAGEAWLPASDAPPVADLAPPGDLPQ
jgi:hypothetical protein